MTLVVGLVNQTGVLLCADTLVASDVIVLYESKILRKGCDRKDLHILESPQRLPTLT